MTDQVTFLGIWRNTVVIEDFHWIRLPFLHPIRNRSLFHFYMHSISKFLCVLTIQTFNLNISIHVHGVIGCRYVIQDPQLLLLCDICRCKCYIDELNHAGISIFIRFF